MCQIDRLVDRVARRDDTEIHLPLARQTYSGYQTRSQINQGAVQPQHPRVRVEHVGAPAGAREFREKSPTAGSGASLRRADIPQ